MIINQCEINMKNKFRKTDHNLFYNNDNKILDKYMSVINVLFILFEKQSQIMKQLNFD